MQFTESLTNGVAFDLMCDTKISGNITELGEYYGQLFLKHDRILIDLKAVMIIIMANYNQIATGHVINF